MTPTLALRHLHSSSRIDSFTVSDRDRVNDFEHIITIILNSFTLHYTSTSIIVII